MADLDARMADLDAMDEAGELYTGTEDEKDKDAEWFRGLSKQWRLKLKSYYEEQALPKQLFKHGVVMPNYNQLSQILLLLLLYVCT
tara:strand:- start:138 stop:395 length:258 start_codon:yes stop_codon:yes gene_type:complete